MAFLGKWGSVLRDFVDENQTLGGRLQNARARQGLSISEVAKLSGVQKKTLMNWELDRYEPRSNRLIQLAGVLGVQAAYLLDGQAGTPPCRKDPRMRSKQCLQISRHRPKRWRVTSSELVRKFSS